MLPPAPYCCETGLTLKGACILQAAANRGKLIGMEYMWAHELQGQTNNMLYLGAMRINLQFDLLRNGQDKNT